MNQELNKEVIKNLMKVEGEVRGIVLKTDAEFILREKRKGGIKKSGGGIGKIRAADKI